MNLLLTGFEPFGKYTINPSGIIAQEFNGKLFFNLKVFGKTIPLRYERINNIIVEYIKEINPSFIINMGQATRPSIAFERVAVNIASCTRSAYNCGSKPNEATLIDGGAPAYFTTLPIQQLTKHLSSNRIPCYISDSAGTFGCNQIMYSTLHFTYESCVRAGFIHLPLLPEQVIETPQSPSMSLDLMKKGIKLVIEFLGKLAREE